jgi:hypothetical protein
LHGDLESPSAMDASATQKITPTPIYGILAKLPETLPE